MDGLFIRSIEENIPLEMIYLADNQELSQRKLIVKEVQDEYIRVCYANKCAPLNEKIYYRLCLNLARNNATFTNPLPTYIHITIFPPIIKSISSLVLL
ncbi:hypothetical protein SAMN05444673_1657 [Bacillus sp. OV166]|uniref:hypothetical protein n=1 Tax=Bacillus sp. OV166 TaxID=1882763 RepID=UPI000A2ACF3C|nr:hypothetical protein [Bacillus sp. OV166]SMQ68594.1 hypothetical protein SAMN05444673_1657 [Bacillus sp. OV166]